MKFLGSFLVMATLAVTANAQTATQKRRAQYLPAHSQQQLQPSIGENCAKGAGNAITATAIATGIGCVIDLFVSGGLLCTTYVTTAVANAPTAAAAGCVVGAIATPKAGTAVGNMTAPHVQLDVPPNAVETVAFSN